MADLSSFQMTLPSSTPVNSSFLRKVFSDEWQLAVALAAGATLLVGYSIQVMIHQGPVVITETIHTIGHGLVWISLALGMVHGLKAAWEAVRELKPDIDVLMVVGAALAAGIGHPEEGALLLFLFTLAGALENRALARAKDAVSRLTKLMPSEALVRRNGAWTPLPPDELIPGDEVLVRPGEVIPADASIIKGRSAIDQSTLTGESLPRSVDEGDDVFAGTLNQQGALELRVTRPVAESSLKRILQLVIEAQERRQPMQRVIDRLSTPYTIAVFTVSIAALIYFAFAGRVEEAGGDRSMTFAEAAYRAITLLIVASPCALVIATPTATLCGLSRAARSGLLVKGGDALERLASVKMVALDKTGTLTTGQIAVVGIEPLSLRDPSNQEASIGRMLGLILGMQEQSTHPIAAAMVRYARSKQVHPAAVSQVENIPGRGLIGMHDGRPIRIGSVEYIGEHIEPSIAEKARVLVAQVRSSGRLATIAEYDGEALVVILADTPRPGASELAAGLRAIGIERVAMLTGDSRTIANKLAGELGITEVHAELLPENKVEHIRRLKSETKGGLAVVGDGVNDAPALAVADVGLAMGGIGADAALEAADVVVLHDDLDRIPWAIELARRVRTIMTVNLLFALSVIAILATLTLLGWVGLGLGVIGHEGSTIVVVANSLQLLAFRGPGMKPGGRK